MCNVYGLSYCDTGTNCDISGANGGFLKCFISRLQGNLPGCCNPLAAPDYIFQC